MSITLVVFLLVYLGMILGKLPWLRMDRASVALGGAIALLAAGEMHQSAALVSIDFGTLGMLFGLMLVSVQLQMSGFYAPLSGAVARLRMSPAGLLALLTALVSGLASNLIIIGSLANIIVVDAAAARGLRISFWDFAKVGLPVSLITLAIAYLWVRVVVAL